jgi:hypothetical protein
MKNPWMDLSESNLVLPDDRPYIDEFNKIQWSLGRKEHILETTLPPSPFLGHHDSPLVVLLANPGVNDADFENQRTPENIKVILDAVRTPGGSPLWALTEAGQKIDTHGWWAKRTKDLADLVGGHEALSKKLLSIELHAYHSDRSGVIMPPFDNLLALW